ncbi:MAG: phosphoserine phosphatase SerB [Alphaproteobacteria bacterium]
MDNIEIVYIASSFKQDEFDSFVKALKKHLSVDQIGDDKISVRSPISAGTLRMLRDELMPFRGDWALKSPEMAPKLVMSDMDSTMINMETLDIMAHFAGKGAEVEAITNQAMRGNLVFEESLMRRLQSIRGEYAAPLFEKVIEKMHQSLNLGAETLLQTLNQRGVKSYLVSGGFNFAAEALADRLGFSEYYANQLEIDRNGRLTGNVSGRIIGKTAKAALLYEKMMMGGLKPFETVAIGDGSNDLDMLNGAGLGIAYQAKPIVRKHCNAQINTGNLEHLLLLSGL